jgi:HD-GYP domain-containing protein (c-di-GMP phosphodiesterase class II)
MDVDKLIDIVTRGGVVQTGVDVYNQKGVLLIEKNIPIRKTSTLLAIKKFGLADVKIDTANHGGIWDKNGNPVAITDEHSKHANQTDPEPLSTVEKKIQEINSIKEEASQKYKKAKEIVKKVIAEIRKTGGEFDYDEVEHTVAEIIHFLIRRDTAFSYMTKEIFTYDDYLSNHAVNVCTIGTAVLKRFNDQFSEAVNKFLSNFTTNPAEKNPNSLTESYINYLPEDLQTMSIGYFLHDVGKVLIPDKILNKPGKFTSAEFDIVRGHTFLNGIEILERNRLTNSTIQNIVKYHHGPLFVEEPGCYPQDKLPIEIPAYVKVAKLADIYDAMTSKRCYKEAFNPVGVVTELFRKYANKDQMLQFILHAFVKIVGIFPPGSIVSLRNGQMGYVLSTDGPIVIPITDTSGNTLNKKLEPVDLSDDNYLRSDFQIDRRKPLQTPIEVYECLPSYLKELIHLQ